MTRIEAFQFWRKAAGPWAQWMKSSLLADDAEDAAEPQPPPSPPLVLPLDPDAGWVLDLPGPAGVEAAVELSARGQCPVLLYNTTSGDKSVVATQALINALMTCGPALTPNREGPPVFLLDSNRGHIDRPPDDGSYDNRWYVFESDFPSAEKLREHGIRRLTLVTRALSNDLRDALAHHTSLELSTLDPSNLAVTPLSAPRGGVVRAVSTFGRKLSMNYDGSFGHTVVVSQG